MQFHRMPELGLRFVLEKRFGDQTLAVVTRFHCIGKNLDSFPRVVHGLNQNGVYRFKAWSSLTQVTLTHSCIILEI